MSREFEDWKCPYGHCSYVPKGTKCYFCGAEAVDMAKVAREREAMFQGIRDVLQGKVPERAVVGRIAVLHIEARIHSLPRQGVALVKFFDGNGRERKLTVPLANLELLPTEDERASLSDEPVLQYLPSDEQSALSPIV